MAYLRRTDDVITSNNYNVTGETFRYVNKTFN